jgi:ABC-type lipoprotein release transport system permease subunit
LDDNPGSNADLPAERNDEMSLYLRLAWRNLWRHKRRTLIVMIAIGLTMAMMMMYDGLIAGFNDAIYGNAIKVLGGNIQVHAAGYQTKADQTPLLPLIHAPDVMKAASALPQVINATQRINTGGLATNREGAFAVTITGIEPDKEAAFSLIAQHVAAGKYLTPQDQDVIFIGKGLADAMSVTVGDRITLAGSTTHQQMRSRTMTVGGIFDIGMADIEKRTVYMSLGEAQTLYDLTGQTTEVVISLKQIGEEAAVMSALKPSLSGEEMTSWQTNFPDLQNTLAMKGQVMDVFSVIILIISGIGILNLLLMAVYERTREIGILGAIGMKPGQISILFLLEGGLMGLTGVFFGVALGLIINLILNRVGIDYSQFTSLTQYTALISGRIYSSLGMEKILQRVFTVLIIAVLAAYYPAREAARNEPAKALHFV